MIYIYTAVFTKLKEKEGYLAKVPDLEGCVTTGKSLADAIEQITDAMSGWLVVAEDEGLPIKEPTKQSQLKLQPEDEVAFIKADTVLYRARTDTRAIRKNVSLPAWLAKMADKKNINCSQVLQEALLQKIQ